MTFPARHLSVLAAALIAGAVAACDPAEEGPPKAGPPEPAAASRGAKVDSAEYAVMSALLRGTALESRRRFSAVVEDSTHGGWRHDGDGSAEAIARRLRLPASVVREYMRRNSRRHPLRPGPGLPNLGPMISPADRRALLADDRSLGIDPGSAGWSEFLKRYPGAQGIATVSRVAFTRDGTAAIARYNLDCGMLCGRGALVRLDRVRGEWKVTARASEWVS